MAANESNQYIPSKTVPPEQLLQSTLFPLAANHFPITRWNIAAINREYLQTKKFCDAVKILSMIGDEDVRNEIIALGVRRSFFQGAPQCTITQMFKFCTWLKTAEGTLAVTGIQKRQALSKKAQPGQTIAKAALQSSFMEQRAEWGQERKELRAFHENKLADLRRQIVLAQEEMEADLHNKDVDFAPAPLFVEQDDNDFMRECHKLYTAECAKMGKEEAPMTDDFFDMLRTNYGDLVRSVWVDKFLDQGTNTEDLKVWVDSKILNLEKRGDKRKATTFRGYLDAAGGELDEEVRTVVAERSVRARRDRRPRAGAAVAVGVDLSNILDKKSINMLASTF